MASLSRFSIATFNLYNHQLPGARMNPGQKPWTEDEFAVKVAWVAQQLHAIDSDIVGLQELWSREAMVRVLQAAAQGPAARHAALGRPLPAGAAPGVQRQRRPDA